MDIKYVLSSILREAEVLGGCGDLAAGVRLSGAVNKEHGEGYFLLYKNGILVLLYRRLGQRDYEGCSGDLSEWSFDNYHDEKYVIRVKMTCRDLSYDCELPVSEREVAEKIFNDITTSHAEPQSVYSENILTMAALLYLLGYNNEKEDAVQVLLGRQLFWAARRFAASRELKDLVGFAAGNFNDEQKKSILLNLIELRMNDDEWSSKEAAALRELAQVWELDNGYFDESVQLLLLLRSLGNLFCN